MSAWLKSTISRFLPRNSFVRGVGVLAGGTAFAQALSILALPFITRLYTPQDFSVLAVYASILGMASVVACLRLEIAIPLPKSDGDGINLLTLAVGLCTVFAILSAAAVFVFADGIIKAVNEPALRPFLWMIPLGIWMTGTYSAIQYWTTRKKRFGAIARTRVVRSIGSVVTQLGFGVLHLLGPFGLLLGQMVNSGAGIVGLLRDAWRHDGRALLSGNRTDLNRVFREHDRFPKYSTIEAFANNAAVQFPVLIIAAAALGAEAGYLFLAMKAMAIPMGLIGGAVSQVYLSAAPDELRAGRLAPFTLTIVRSLAKLGIGPLIFSAIVAPAVFPLVFGDGWHRAGQLVMWMTPWFIMQFLSSPVSMALHVTNSQRLAMGLQFFGLAMRVGLTGSAAYFLKSHIAEYYAISGFIFYSVYFFVIIKIIGIKSRELFKVMLKSFPICAAWFVGGISIVLFVNLIR